MTITDLPAGKDVTVTLAAVGAGGLSSPKVTLSARTSAALEAPKAPAVAGPARAAAEPLVSSGRMRVWAYPEIAKVDPVTGDFLSGGEGESKGANAVFDASTKTITLTAAAGEIAAFQVAVERIGEPLTGVNVAAGRWEIRSGRGAGFTIPPRINMERLRVLRRMQANLFREWYVRPDGSTWQADLAVPLSGPVSIPYAPNNVDGQTLQSFWVDVVVARSLPPGEYSSAVTVAADGLAPTEMPVAPHRRRRDDLAGVRLLGRTNGYGAPGGSGTDYYAIHRLAHYHRCAREYPPVQPGAR